MDKVPQEPQTPASRGTGVEGATIEERLVRLQRLRDKGLITAYDFEKRKAQILDGI